MILLGCTTAEKPGEVARYVAEHGIRRVFVLGPRRFAFPTPTEHEWIDWPDVIRYVFYYRLLQEIDKQTLVVVNEPLRTQNRSDLTYNCLRNFLNQTEHQLIFQRLPLIDTMDDFATVFDFDTRSRWKRTSVAELPLAEAGIEVRRVLTPTIRPVEVPTSPKLQAQYAAERTRLFAELGAGDPHTLPRQLHQLGGKAKLGRVEPERLYVGRNYRFRLPNLCTYRETAPSSPTRVVFEWCHNFLDMADFLACTDQTEVEVLTTDLKVDQWYLQRYQAWAGRVGDAYAALHG